jgi:hypothetical protein
MLLVLAFALLPTPALADDRDPPAPVKQCRTHPQYAAKPQPIPGPDRPQRLNELPEAEAFYAVLRIEDGCEVPVKVREYRARRR